jgi:LuxR family maltose regulon positive regulatory protein
MTGSGSTLDERATGDATSRAAHHDTDSGWLLVGKLAPPEQRVTVATRTQLLERLEAGLGRAVSVIVSPPGFGKTTLLTQWWRTLQQRDGVAAAWLTVDPLDAEVSRFVAGAILAVAQAGVDVGALEIAARQQAIDTNVRPIALALLEAIRRSGRRVVLVLDDFHRARSAAVDEILGTLIEHAHGCLHLVIGARQRPTFHVSALWARGLVTFLDAGDLALSRDEAAQVVGPDVSAADLALLHQRTEGWAVALQLARLWLDRGQRRPASLREFSGRTTEMTDYLAEQIVEDLAPELRDFLLETSILERFDAPLANAVRGRDDSARLLERLATFEALLVPLDEGRDWFRYHHLFGDFLAQRLRRGPPERVAALHRRAARALAAIGDLQQAVQHALDARDTALAVELAQAAGGWELILTRGIGYVRSLLKAFDDLTIRSEPVLALTQGYLDIKLGRFEGAREMLALADASIDGDDRRLRRDLHIIQALWRIYLDDLGDPRWRTWIERQVEEVEPADHLGRGTLLCGLAITSLGRGDVLRAETEGRRAIREMRASGSILGTNYAFLHMAQSQLLRGRLREAEALFREAFTMAEENFGADSGLKALCSTFLGHCHWLRGDGEGAARLLQSSFDTTDGWVDVFATAYEVRLRLAFAEGGLGPAIEVIGSAAETARTRQLERLRELAGAWRVELLATSGHLQDARREATVAGVHAAAELRGRPDFRWRTRLAATLAVAKLNAACGATAPALQLLDAARGEFRAAGLELAAARLDAASVGVLKQRGAHEEAADRLQVLLEFVAAEGAIGILVEHGHALEAPLHAVQRRHRELVVSGAQREAIGSALAILEQSRAEEQDGFSSRELEVLRELCHGRSNKAIGQLLDLSENTVKFHLKRIFRKLGADSRAGAIAAALARRLVAPDDAAKKPGRS